MPTPLIKRCKSLPCGGNSICTKICKSCEEDVQWPKLSESLHANNEHGDCEAIGKSVMETLFGNYSGICMYI